MNLMINVNPETLKKARIRALEENTTVSEVLKCYLEQYAGLTTESAQALDRILKLSNEINTGSGARTWTRSELYER